MLELEKVVFEQLINCNVLASSPKSHLVSLIEPGKQDKNDSFTKIRYCEKQHKTTSGEPKILDLKPTFLLLC